MTKHTKQKLIIYHMILFFKDFSLNNTFVVFYITIYFDIKFNLNSSINAFIHVIAICLMFYSNTDKEIELKFR
jgi:hypothetical protein